MNPAATAILSDAVVQMCTFTVLGRTYAVDVLDVREINNEVSITPVDHARASVRGLVNVRGQIFLILDAAHLLGRGRSETTEESRVLLLKESVGPRFGILVDRVGDIVTFPERDIITSEFDGVTDKASTGSPHADKIIRGVCKLEEDLVVLLDAHHLLSTSRD